MGQTRREFLSSSVASLAAAAVANGSLAAAERPTKDDISLAVWSINRSYYVSNKTTWPTCSNVAPRWRNLDLPRICREEFDINGLELVSYFFESAMQRYLQEMKKAADSYGVRYVLIMISGEGDMCAKDKSERMLAARAHRRWIDMGHYLGCHAIRCDLGGSREGWKEDKDLVKRAAESFNNLLEYAKEANTNVILENHDGASSDPDVVVSLMKTVNNPNFGTLPDFGNTNPGDNREEVLRRIVPWAKGISVKASWSPDGKSSFDLEPLLRICQESGYHGFYGIESSYGPRRAPGAAKAPPEQLSPDQLWENELKGVKLTKAVLDRVILKKLA